MNANEYIQKALKTESGEYPFPTTGSVTPRIEHAVMGIVTEAGELMDSIKKAKIYGNELDKINLVEEAGDVMWYLALLADELGVSFEEIWEKNINKLAKRYGGKYSKDSANHRNLSDERKILEN